MTDWRNDILDSCVLRRRSVVQNNSGIGYTFVSIQRCVKFVKESCFCRRLGVQLHQSPLSATSWTNTVTRWLQSSIAPPAAAYVTSPTNACSLFLISWWFGRRLLLSAVNWMPNHRPTNMTTSHLGRCCLPSTVSMFVCYFVCDFVIRLTRKCCGFHHKSFRLEIDNSLEITPLNFGLYRIGLKFTLMYQKCNKMSIEQPGEWCSALHCLFNTVLGISKWRI